MRESRIAIISPMVVDYGGHYYSFILETLEGLKAVFEDVKVDVIVGTYCKVNNENFRHLIPESFITSYLKSNISKFRASMKAAKDLSVLITSLQEQYDALIFTECYELRVNLAVLFLKRIEKPMIMYVHSFHGMHGNFGLKGKLISFLLSFSDRLDNVHFLTYLDFEEYDKKTKRLMRKFLNKGAKIVYGVPFPTSKIRLPNVRINKPLEPFIVSYFGEARLSKNFPSVVELVKHSKEKNLDIRFQVSSYYPKNSEEKPVRTKVEELLKLQYDNLRILENPLTIEEYHNLLSQSSVILLLYDAKTYRTAFSGILLESFAYGKPIITTPGTWLTRQVEKYGGGVIVQSTEPEEVLKAIEEIRKNYEKYHNEALEAGKQLMQKHNAVELAKLIKQILENKR